MNMVPDINTHSHTCWSRYPPTNTQLIRTRDRVAELFPSETTSIFCGPDSKHLGAFCSGWQIPELHHQTTTGQLILEDWEHGGLIPWEPVTDQEHLHKKTPKQTGDSQRRRNMAFSVFTVRVEMSLVGLSPNRQVYVLFLETSQWVEKDWVSRWFRCIVQRGEAATGLTQVVFYLRVSSTFGSWNSEESV